jgi:hypothetical protein
MAFKTIDDLKVGDYVLKYKHRDRWIISRAIVMTIHFNYTDNFVSQVDVLNIGLAPGRARACFFRNEQNEFDVVNVR